MSPLMNDPNRNAAASTNLVAESFTTSNGKVAQCLFGNNPWQVTSARQKIYRYCVICGQNRFTDEVWQNLINEKLLGSSPAICSKPSCWNTYEQVNFNKIPSHYFLLNRD